MERETRVNDVHFEEDKSVRGGVREEPPELGNIAKHEQVDDTTNPGIHPAEPRCRRCGQPFSTEEELAEHVKTCKGGHDPRPRTHSSR